jgi:hypothetical protein
MSAQAGILDERDPVSKGFLGALALHLAILGGAVAYTWINGHRDTFGTPDAGAGAVGVEAVRSIPIPHEGIKNPVANDSPSEAPQIQEKVPEKQESVKEDIPPDAVRIKGRTTKKNAAKPRFKSYDALALNQLTSTLPQAASTEAFTAAPGAGRIGAGENNMLGNRFPAYAAQIRALIAQRWRTGDVDPAVKTAPMVMVNFDLMRDGTVQGFSFLQKSGISSLDYSVQRAITDGPLLPLPREFERSSAKVEFWFELKR